MNSAKHHLLRFKNSKHLLFAFKGLLWFSLGATIGLFFFISFIFMYYQKTYKNVVYPGIYVDGIHFGGKTEADVEQYFQIRNERIGQTTFTFVAAELSATASAKELGFGYDAPLLAKQAASIGRSDNFFSNVSLIAQAYFHGVDLPASYGFSEDKLEELIKPMQKTITVEPVNALFSFQNGKVSAFKPSTDGQQLDFEKLKAQVEAKMLPVIVAKKSKAITINVPIIVIKPKITTEKVNNLGIKELLATGTSLFVGSIENRIYNISLAASRLNGVLIPPSEVFSFNKALGDISVFTGFKQAYVIQNGRTVLGDGGGVCQVSTTFFRAVLNAGLPIVERNQHAYRVSYYEQDMGPGVDAAIYSPGTDFQFKNDTKHHILVQTHIDVYQQRLTFELYGTSDEREVTISKPVILSQTPAPEPEYQDDPNLPKGQVKQVDFAAPGASVYFIREVKKDGKVIITDKFSSNYRPWKAVFLRGTKEG